MFKPKNNSFNQSVTWLLNEKYQGQLTPSAHKDIQRLRAGEPVDYVIGFKDFLGCKIDLRYKPLIPREETAHWVNEAIMALKAGPQKKLHCLDIFAGSGCCGLAVLKNLPNTYCYFADVSDRALQQIRLNLKLNLIEKQRYRVIKSDVFANIKGHYDLILANPPYIAAGRIKKVQKSAIQHEPQEALIAKDKGLFLIKQFLKQAQQHLTDDGIIYLEFDAPQKKEIALILKKLDYHHYQFHRDQFHHWRHVVIWA